MANTFSELQIWKRQLVKADTQLRNFEASTQRALLIYTLSLSTSQTLQDPDRCNTICVFVHAELTLQESERCNTIRVFEREREMKVFVYAELTGMLDTTLHAYPRVSIHALVCFLQFRCIAHDLQPHPHRAYVSCPALFCLRFAQVWQHTSLGANDGHLPQEVASLPVPATAPVAHMSAETTQVRVHTA